MRLAPFAVCSVLVIGEAAAMFGQPSSRQVIGGSNPNLPFSTAIKAGGFIYVSGTIGAGPNVTGDVRKQTKDTLDSIAGTLTAAGSSLANAASVSVYLRHASDFAAMNEVYATYFPKDPPARTTVVLTQPLALPEGLIEISVVAIPNGGERLVIHPREWIKSPAPYSYGIKSGDTLFLSGLISRNGKDNTLVTGDLAAQTRVVMDNGAAILKEAGMGFGDVVSSRVWVAADSNQAMNDVYRTYFDGVAPPARAAVQGRPAGFGLPRRGHDDCGQGSIRKAIVPPNPDGSPGRAGANLSPAIQVGNRLYVAGMLGNTPGNKGDARAQTTEALARIGRTLKAAGFEWSDVVDGLVYLPDMSKFQDMNAAYREVFTKNFPARATIGTGLGGDALVEIMFTAVR